MKSDGGFACEEQVLASQLLLSGPAGGLIGYAGMGPELEKLFGLKVQSLVGLDMGGTSTDISAVRNHEF
jgi:5-oxoprolinase (ATP-hydrolysing)